MTEAEARRLIEIYGKAWETKDSELAASIFVPEAVYLHPNEPENKGKEEIIKYWESKVVEEQEDIQFKIKSVIINGDVVVAQWHVIFNDVKRKLCITMQEAATFTVKDGKFSSIKETYKSKKIPY